MPLQNQFKNQFKVSWWKWLLFVLASAVLIAVVLMGAMVALYWYWAIDLREYVTSTTPPALTNGTASFLILFSLLGTTVIPVSLLALMPRTRALMAAKLTWPRWGALRRLMLGVLIFALLQWAWDRWGMRPPQEMRLLEHIMAAVRAGGQFWPTFWLLLFIGGVGPLVEELFFRGMLLGALRQRYAFWPAALLTAISFGLGHGLVMGLPSALMGLYFCWQVERDDSLVPALMLHAANNTLAVLLALLATGR
ncbi:MAG TPA: type II CAAX endopeptidase family protein [Symbiobacteriaceae bacterium]|nr:type II CAAX endopeptidase family protein [Symbiobacteriaceae bacterium]